MANRSWYDDDGETRAQKSRDEIVAEMVNDFAVLELTDELELTDGCEACFAWVFGSGLQCEQHSDELRHLREQGD